MTYQIVPTRMVHVAPMARAMREGAKDTICALGLNSRRVLHDAVVGSHYCRVAIKDGKPIAMWGLKGVMLSGYAFVWLALSAPAQAMPRRVIVEATHELARMGEQFEELATTVLPEDDAAIRLAAFLGFHDQHEKDGTTMPYRDRVKQLKHDPRHRVAFGGAEVIALGWHGRA